MKLHIKTHTGKRLCKCKHCVNCHKCFTKTTALKIQHSGEKPWNPTRFAIWIVYVKISSHWSHLKCIPQYVSSSVLSCNVYTHGELQQVLQFCYFFWTFHHICHTLTPPPFYPSIELQCKWKLPWMKAKIKCFPRVSSMCIFKIPAGVSALQHNSQIKPWIGCLIPVCCISAFWKYRLDWMCFNIYHNQNAKLCVWPRCVEHVPFEFTNWSECVTIMATI